jgi:flagellar motor switch protein FliM
MSDVLSQSQIDALLASMKDEQAAQDEKAQSAPPKKTGPHPENDNYKKYDFYSPRKFTKEKLKLLRNIFENYARILTSRVNGIFGMMTDITVLDLKESRYYEYVNSFRENDCVTIVDSYLPDRNKSNVPLMVYVTPGLVLTLMNHMLGGGDQILQVEEEYRYTDVEMALYRRILDYVVQALSDGFANYLPVEFHSQRVEENLSMVQEVGLDETVVLVVLNVDVAGVASEKIRICLPGTLLEQLFHIIDGRKHIARGFHYENNEERILEHLRDSRLPLVAKLGTIRMKMEDLANLKVGDVIDMNLSKNSQLTLCVQDQPWFTGTMGTHHRNLAFRVEERCAVPSPEEDVPPHEQQTPPSEGA